MMRKFWGVALCVMCCGGRAYTSEHSQSEREVAQPSDASSTLPVDDIRRFVAVYNAVKQAYVDPVDDHTLMHSAIRGLLTGLDPHSTYFDNEDAQAFEEQTTGAYEGIGIELQQQPDNTLKVISAIDETPAARAGIRSGDVIVAIEGKPIATISSVSPLRGRSGTWVTLRILRQHDAPFDVRVRREIIHVASVRNRMLEPGYGYVRISTFQSNSAIDFKTQLSLLQTQAGGHLSGLVLDLRSNPGGLLTAAVQIADDLLDKGIITTTRGRIAASDSHFDATPGDLLHGAPLVVIVDAGSASASEVLASALHDNHRAVLIGSRTFGKGSVQTLLPLDNGDSIKLTTARYYTPNGGSIQAEGIQPDIVLVSDESTKKQKEHVYSEASLPGHLTSDAKSDKKSATVGETLPGDGPIKAALVQLKQLKPGARTG